MTIVRWVGYFWFFSHQEEIRKRVCHSENIKSILCFGVGKEIAAVYLYKSVLVRIPFKAASFVFVDCGHHCNCSFQHIFFSQEKP